MPEPRFKVRTSTIEAFAIANGNTKSVVPESTIKNMKKDISSWRTNLKKNMSTLNKHGWSTSGYANNLIGGSSVKGKSEQELAQIWINLYVLQMQTNLSYTERKKKDEERIKEIKNPKLREAIKTADDYEKFSEFEAAVRDLWSSLDVDSDDVAEWYVNEVKKGDDQTDILITSFEKWLDENSKIRFLR